MERRIPARDGDRMQARQRVNNLVTRGFLPRVSTMKCTDCGKDAQAYDHYLGYDAEHHEHVQPVCDSCHEIREVARGTHGKPPTSVDKCVVCSKVSGPYTHGRCPRCWAYYNAYGRERPERLWDHEKPTQCANCGKKDWRYSKGRCHTCSEYLRRTGRDRVVNPSS